MASETPNRLKAQQLHYAYKYYVYDQRRPAHENQTFLGMKCVGVRGRYIFKDTVVYGGNDDKYSRACTLLTESARILLH